MHWRERNKMRILRLHIENFGTLHDYDLELQDGLHVIHEENGWGKSTLAAFIKAMFYGLPRTAKRSLAENDRKHYLPWQGGAFGGSLEFQTEDRTYRAERFFGAKEREDTFELYDLETGLVSLDYSEHLGEELFLVDRAAFERSCFFRQQDYAVIMNDSLNAGLTHAEQEIGDAGNYEQAVASLENRMKYYRKIGNRGQIAKLEEERRQVREELSACRAQENAMEEENGRLLLLRQSAEKAASTAEETEKALRTAQEHAQTRAKKAQYDLLKNQVKEQQAELRQMAALLEEGGNSARGEEELDRCRERIYQLDALKQKEEEAKKQAAEAVSRLGDAEDEKNDRSFPGMFFGIAAVLLPVMGVFCLFRKAAAAGIVFLAAGAMIAFLGFWTMRRYRRQGEQLDLQIEESSQEVRRTDRALREIQKKQETLEKKICEFLALSHPVKTAEMEARWKQERKKSREQRELKQKYESRKTEVSRSIELLRRYEEGFSQEERRRLSDPGEGVPDVQVWKRKLEEQRKRLDELKKEERELAYRITGFQEEAERIPELQERETELSEKLSDAVREHALLEQTVRYLKMAREQLSSRYLYELQNRMEEYLSKLESGETLPVLVDVSLQLKVQEAGAYRSLEYQSAGRQDLLRFAERLAVLDVLYKEEQPVLILDDPFVNLDTARRRRALELLKEHAGRRQMIYFTCQDG